MRVALLSHGYPPHEAAGTEQYTQRVAEGLRARGDTVRVFVAAPRSGARAYAVCEDPAVWRVVQNAPYAALRHAGSDPAIDALVGEAVRRFAPDVVGVQHLQNLSLTLALPAPWVWTLHDAWGWCAAGGLLLRDGRPCDGPGAACGPCASAWVRDPPIVSGLLRASGRLSRWVAPERLHAGWQALPAGLRARVTAARAAPVEARHTDARRMRAGVFAGGAHALVSPSRWLAEEARAQGFPAVRVLPHGVDAAPAARDPDGPFVFVGTLAPHKGPDVVVEAHRRSGVARPLLVHGPAGPDPAFAARFPGARALSQDEVRRALAGARALVMGSLWPENAPLIALEARAQGCPVIAPSAGGLPELVAHGRDGLLYARGDVDALARALREADARPFPDVAPPPTFARHLDAYRALLLAAAGAPGRTP
jgi:glycosyltransferase involved in cell wall biosynthesis